MYWAATVPYKTNLIPTVMPLPLPSPASPPLPPLELGGGNLGGPTTAFTSLTSFFTSINSFRASYRSFFTSINSFLTSSNASFSPITSACVISVFRAIAFAIYINFAASILVIESYTILTASSKVLLWILMAWPTSFIVMSSTVWPTTMVDRLFSSALSLSTLQI